jgi:MFS transporter, DHA2 family, methylenomycin A resistance protein
MPRIDAGSPTAELFFRGFAHGKSGGRGIAFLWQCFWGATDMEQKASYSWIIATTALAFVVSQLDVSIVNIALPPIGRSFSAGIGTLQWVIDAYTVLFAVGMLSAGSIGDLYGHKRIFQLGIVVFGIASMGCGLSWNAFSIVLFRALQGVGAAAMIPSSLAILNQAFSEDKQKRALAIAQWTAAGAVAIGAGPVIGGILIKAVGWRWIFFVNAPICLAAILLSLKLPKFNAKHGGRLDIRGQIAWALGLTALIAGIIEFPSRGLSNPLVAGCLLFSLLVLAAFVWLEKKTASPMLPLSLFDSSSFNVLLLVGVLLNGAYYGIVFVLNLYLQNVLHYKALTAGLAFLPLTLGFLISNLVSGRLINKYGARVPILAGLSIFIVGFLGLLITQTDTPYWKLFAPFLVIPMGMGLAVPAMTNAILGSVDKSLSGTAAAVLNTARQAAGAMGVAVFGAMANGGSGEILHSIKLSTIIAGAGAGLLIAGICIYLPRVKSQGANSPVSAAHN